MVETGYNRYIFLDVVKYSFNRTVEAQSEIIENLNKIVRSSINNFEINSNDLVYLPTGDGLCISLIDILNPYDIHIKIALNILEDLEIYNKKQTIDNRKFTLRIGINENQDNIINDINGSRNIAGSGINYAQRIMDFGDDNQIYISETVYDKLNQRDQYNGKFVPSVKEIKHNIFLKAYRYINEELEFLNNHIETIDEEDVDDEEEMLPEFVANYISLIEILKEVYVPLNRLGSASYSIKIVLTYLTEDLLAFKCLSEIEKQTWKSKIFNQDIKSFKKAFQKIENAFFYLISNSSAYNDDKYNFSNWYELFSTYKLLINEQGLNKLKNDWPNIIDENKILISKLLPNLLDK